MKNFYTFCLLASCVVLGTAAATMLGCQQPGGSSADTGATASGTDDSGSGIVEDATASGSTATDSGDTQSGDTQSGDTQSGVSESNETGARGAEDTTSAEASTSGSGSAKTPAKTSPATDTTGPELEPATGEGASQPTENDQASAPVADKAPADDMPVADGTVQQGDWSQWGGNSYRNNVPVTDATIVTEWNPGRFDRRTGEWQAETAENIKWVAALGSQSYGNPVVAGGKIYVGTNNSGGYLKRYPNDVDLGVLLCFNEADGKFLWQHSSEKLPTGRVHDWELQGICCAPYVVGDRLWFVTSRGEVRCLDTEGFYDGEDDGPVKAEPARLFDLRQSDENAAAVQAAIDALNAGTVDEMLRGLFADAGMELPETVTIAPEKPGAVWLIKAEVDGVGRDIKVSKAGPTLSAFKMLNAADKNEADVVWVFDMMQELGVSQHNMCSCSITGLGDLIFVNTSNGVDESHINIPAPNAPSFFCMDKNTGEVYWTDKSPGTNILHGQWSSPTIANLGGVNQVLYAGGDGWLYSFKADKGADGKPELLWKFDANPKESLWELGGAGTRNNIIATPVAHDGRVYVAVGQDPEHGEGTGHLWCIDPTKRGDVSPQLAVKENDPTQIVPHRRLQAVVPEEGETAIPNPNSAAIWHYHASDSNGNGRIDFEEEMHRSCGTVAIKDGLLYIADFSGLFHCLDAKTGDVHWTYDMLAAAWGSPLIVHDHVYIGDEDGDICVFELSAEPQEPISEINMGNSVYSTPIIANGVLYIANRTHLFAITPSGAETAAAGGE